MAKQPFKTETELCAAFLAALETGDPRRFHRREPMTAQWTAYAETAGWDILLVRKADGLQVGVQAKLRLNADVVAQVLEEYGSWSAGNAGPDFRAVLVPAVTASRFDQVSRYIGFTIIRMAGPDRADWVPPFQPGLPTPPDDNAYASSPDWHYWCPVKRHPLPDYVPDVEAGASAPLQLSDWKVKALKIVATIEIRGAVTRADFKHIGIDHRRWLTPGGEWLASTPQGYIVGPRCPDFRGQHPRVYAEIKADADRWIRKTLVDQPEPRQGELYVRQ